MNVDFFFFIRDFRSSCLLFRVNYFKILINYIKLNVIKINIYENSLYNF